MDRTRSFTIGDYVPPPWDLAALIVCALIGCLIDARPVRAQPNAPSLVVLITIDQFRADYLDRFDRDLSGGLKRLEHGARFTNANHDHAITETAPGHATLWSGRHPRSTGIMLNRVGVDDAAYPLLDRALGTGASPARFTGTTLIDWIRSRDGKSRVLSVSMKDRGAILPVGRSVADVFWYSPDGRFTTSTYYARRLPDWARQWNARGLPARYAGQRWELVLPDSMYTERDSVRVESVGQDIAFPHLLPALVGDAASYVRRTPFIDDLTLSFALAGLDARGLGDDRSATPRTDVLAISLSATDVIGHTFGPDSREMHDQIVRLDRTLGRFLDSLYARRDSSRVLVALSSDHGVGTIPEVAATWTPTPVPIPSRVSLYDLLPDTRSALRTGGVDTNAIDIDEQIVLMDRRAFAGKSVDPDAVLAALADRARNTLGVLRVDRLRDVYADSASDPIARRWTHQFPRTGTNVELVVTLAPYSTWGGNVASHGSVHGYDTHVPLLLSGWGVQPGRYAREVRTVDLAPTLAAILGLTPAERVDGTVLREAVRVR